MDEETFQQRFGQWESMLGEEDGPYSAADIPKYDSLCLLYLEAQPEQRLRLPKMVAPLNSQKGYYRLGYLIAYMRWVAQRLLTTNNLQALYFGLAAAAILEERIDDRDVMFSLAFLHNAATQAGINPAPYFKEVAEMARPETKGFIRAFLERSKRDIRYMVREFSE